MSDEKRVEIGRYEGEGTKIFLEDRLRRDRLSLEPFRTWLAERGVPFRFETY